MSKIKLPSEVWVELYTELSAHILEYSSLDPVTFVDENGEERYTEEKQDQFCQIVDDVESIMGTFFKKEDEEKQKKTD